MSGSVPPLVFIGGGVYCCNVVRSCSVMVFVLMCVVNLMLFHYCVWNCVYVLSFWVVGVLDVVFLFDL